MAARTTKLKLGANIVPIGRNPMLLARQLAQLDQLCGGRLLLAFVPGVDQPGERARARLPDRVTAWAVMLDVIGLLRRWWAVSASSCRRTTSTSGASRVGPTPVQTPLEIWMGGAGPRTLAARRSGRGRLADGQHHARGGGPRPGSIVAAATEPAGRSTRSTSASACRTPVRLCRMRRSPRCAPGGPRRPDPDEIVPIGADALVRLLRRHIDAGLSKFVLRPADPVALGDDLAWLADVVLPLQT